MCASAEIGTVNRGRRPANSDVCMQTRRVRRLEIQIDRKLRRSPRDRAKRDRKCSCRRRQCCIEMDALVTPLLLSSSGGWLVGWMDELASCCCRRMQFSCPIYELLRSIARDAKLLVSLCFLLGFYA
jgi:hypothetical protein